MIILEFKADLTKQHETEKLVEARLEIIYQVQGPNGVKLIVCTPASFVKTPRPDSRTLEGSTCLITIWILREETAPVIPLFPIFNYWIWQEVKCTLKCQW